MSYVIVGFVCALLGAGLLVLGIWLHVREDERREVVLSPEERDLAEQRSKDFVQ